MPRIRWSLQSREDLLSIRRYIAFQNPVRAKQYVRKIRSSVNRLKQFPLLGEVVPDLGRGDVRQVLHGNYRVIYQTDGKSVEVLSIVHSARLLDEGTID